MADQKPLKTRITDLRFGEQRDPNAGNTLDLREMPVGEPMPMSPSTINLRPSQDVAEQKAGTITTRPSKYAGGEGSLRSRIRESISQPTHVFREQVPKKQAKEANSEGPVRQFFEAVPGVLPIAPAPSPSAPERPVYTKANKASFDEPSSKEVRRMRRALFVVAVIVLIASLISRLTSSGESGSYHTKELQEAVGPKQTETPSDSGSDPGAEPPSGDPPAPPATRTQTREESSSPSSEPSSEQGGVGGGSLDPKVCATGPTGVLSETCLIVDPNISPADPGVQLAQ